LPSPKVFPFLDCLLLLPARPGRSLTADEKGSIATLHRAIEIGYNFFDTAQLKCFLRLSPIIAASLTGTVWNKKDSAA
jgi:hypothetical protein